MLCLLRACAARMLTGCWVSVQAITASDVKEFMKKLLASKPSGVLLGDQTVMPKFDAVKQRFQ